MTEKKRLLKRIKAGQKITGTDAFAAAGFGLGDLQRSEDGGFYLSTIRSLGIKTPAGRKQKTN